MVNAHYPAPITDFKIKFWRYTLTDIVRIGCPFLAGLLLAGLTGAIVGALIGLGVAEIRIHGKTIDQVITGFVRFQAEQSSLDPEFEIRDNVIVSESGTVVGIVEIDSVDLNMSSDREWQVNIESVADLFRKIDSPLEIHSRKRQVDLSAFAGTRNNGVTTDHYVVVREFADSDSDSVEEQIEAVRDRSNWIRNSLNAGDLSAEHVTDSRLKHVLNRLQPIDPSLTHQGYTVGETHYRTLAISKYPEERPPGLLSEILNEQTEGFVKIVQAVAPVSDRQRRKLGRLVGRMRAESVATPNPLRGSEIDRQLVDAQDLIDVEESGNERLVNAAAYIIIRAEEAETVDETVEDVTRLLRRSGVEYSEPWLETPQAVQTGSALHPDTLDRSMIMPSRSAASSFSFSTHGSVDRNGISFGLDTRNGMPLIMDRFGWDASHIARLGKSGAGKSFYAKLSLQRSWQTYDGLHTYIIDPDDEYGGLIDTVGGETVVLDQTDLSTVNPGQVMRYTVSDPSRDNSDELTQAIRHVYRISAETTDPTIILVDEAHRLLTDADGRTALGQLVREGRKRGISVEITTQNTSDFIHSREGRDILKNVNCYIFMKHQDVETGLTEFFNLSPQEAVELRRLRTGTELPFSEAIIRGPVSTKLRITATEAEQTAITNEPSNSQEQPMTDGPETTGEESASETTIDRSPRKASQTDGGTIVPSLDTERRNQVLETNSRTAGPPRSEHGRETADAAMELPDTCITEQAELDGSATPEELLPEELPGWARPKTDKYRWTVPKAEDWITATYLDPVGNRYMVHISRWKPDLVRYVIENLYGIGVPTRFDIWTARGRYVFAVKIIDGTIGQAKILLAASPALSKGYLNQLDRGGLD